MNIGIRRAVRINHAFKSQRPYFPENAFPHRPERKTEASGRDASAAREFEHPPRRSSRIEGEVAFRPVLPRFPHVPRWWRRCRCLCYFRSLWDGDRIVSASGAVPGTIGKDPSMVARCAVGAKLKPSSIASERTVAAGKMPPSTLEPPRRTGADPSRHCAEVGCQNKRKPINVTKSGTAAVSIGITWQCTSPPRSA